jgi:hypothetical protein
MKTKAKTNDPKPVKLADLKVRKDPKGGAQKGRLNNLSQRGGGAGPQNHNETFLADR